MKWKLTDQQVADHFPVSKLSRYGKAWHACICTKLMPCQHMSDVINQRAALLFCIAKDYSVDIGEVIYDSVLKGIEPGTTGGLPHPSLITALCRQAGVQWDEKEEVLKSLPPIDHKAMARYKIWTGADSHPRGLGFKPIHPVSNEQPSDNPTAASSSMPLINFVEDITRQINMVATQIQQGFDRMNKQQNRLDQRQAKIYLNFNASLREMLNRMNPADAPYQFPPPPPLFVYPPD